MKKILSEFILLLGLMLIVAGASSYVLNLLSMTNIVIFGALGLIFVGVGSGIKHKT